MTADPRFYGFLSFTHGWGRVLTVMSPAGSSAVLRAIVPGEDTVLHVADGRLPQFHEKRAGGLERLIATYGITVLSSEDWTARKAEIGKNLHD